ncbi:MAG: hypothetical protein COB66_01235 [Coxiella sp. (in: Bacteria)]|nr:MAG: hypothetical protein COB66_01235 [Coxiella sp. (in: g-proteobacteria)]
MKQLTLLIFTLVTLGISLQSMAVSSNQKTKHRVQQLQKKQNAEKRALQEKCRTQKQTLKKKHQQERNQLKQKQKQKQPRES